jgi:hypothetical protein
MSEVGEAPARARHVGRILLIVFSWLWCALASIIGISSLPMGRVVVALTFFAAAILVAPPSWPMLARFGVHAPPRVIRVMLVVGAWVLAFIAIVATDPHLPKGRAGIAGIPAQTAAPLAIEGPSTCDGIKAAPRDFAVREGAPLQERADAQSGQVSIPFGVGKEMKPVSIDPTMPVRELCRSGKWSFVSILQLPSDIGNGKGWVPTGKLRPVETDKGGRRIYEVADFEWPDGSKPYRKSALAVVNRIMAQNPRCDAVGSQALLFDKDRAGALFKVACFGATEQVFDFRPDDATNGRSFAPVDPIGEKAAREACWNAATERANHPSTVDISTFGGQFQSDDSGGASYRTTFTAKNSFNLTLNYTILCTFKGSNFVGVDIQETAE